MNERQAARLKRLSDYLHSKSRSLFMFELLVPAEKAQLDQVGGDKTKYDLEMRPALMVQAIETLQLFGLDRIYTDALTPQIDGANVLPQN